MAFALDGRTIGESPEEITRGLIDGWLPGTCYRLRPAGTRRPDDRLHDGPRRRRLRRSGALGVSGRTAGPGEVAPGGPAGDPADHVRLLREEPGGQGRPDDLRPRRRPAFSWMATGRPCAHADGSIAVWSSRAGRWAGTPLEPRLEIRMPLRRAAADAGPGGAARRPEDPRPAALAGATI